MIDSYAKHLLEALEMDQNDPSLLAQASIFIEALTIYEQRNKKYQDNWKRMGWRGCLVRIRERSERLWDHWWNRDNANYDDVDDAIDLINFAAFWARGVRGETTRDGEWWS